MPAQSNKGAPSGFTAECHCFTINVTSSCSPADIRSLSYHPLASRMDLVTKAHLTWYTVKVG